MIPEYFVNKKKMILKQRYECFWALNEECIAVSRGRLTLTTALLSNVVIG